MIAGWKDEPEEERCPDGSQCPQCGENRIDYLWWDKEGIQVTCDTCGCVYEPDKRPEDGTEQDQ
jgi:hypothetical protein